MWVFSPPKTTTYLGSQSRAIYMVVVDVSDGVRRISKVAIRIV